MKRTAITCFALFAPLSVSALLAQAAGTGGATSAYRISYYDLAIRVDPETRTIRGCVRAVGRVGASPLATLTLDLATVMAVDSATTRRRGKSSPLAVTHNSYTLGLARSAAWVAREPFDVTVCYHGTPPESAVLFAGRGDSARVGSYGLPYSAREWWPSHDSPAQKADSADIRITAPSALTVASNGREVERVVHDDGSATTHWAVRYPIYPDVISLAIARYATFTLTAPTPRGPAVPMQFFAFPEDEAKARTDFSALPQILAHHVRRFGEYPFAREKYGVAEFPVQSFREHQTIPSYGPQYITGDHRNDWILAHELAHQWFGNALTVRSWSDVWLNEGFSTYAAWLWIEEAKGKAAYDSVVASRMKLEFPHPVFVADSLDVDHMFDPSTFFKGAIVLHMLRHVMGDELFFRALQSYVAANLHKNVTTATFQSVCEGTLKQPLGWFFKEWVYGIGAPSYAVNWNQRRGARGFDVEVTVFQAQEGGVFTMPIDLALRTVRGDLLRIVTDSTRIAKATFTVPDSVTAVSLDPGSWILTDTRRAPRPPVF